jgi:hypothetical protein
MERANQQYVVAFLLVQTRELQLIFENGTHNYTQKNKGYLYYKRQDNH